MVKLGLSLATFMVTILFTVTRSRYSILRRYLLLQRSVSGCAKCLTCGVEISGLCPHRPDEHDWCRCLWR